MKTHMVGCEIRLEKLKNMKNEKCTLQDLEYGEKTEHMEKVKHMLQDMKYGRKH